MDEPIRFCGRVRHWKEDPPGGLAVIDIPAEPVERLGHIQAVGGSGRSRGH
jgi:hypothetical protein